MSLKTRALALFSAAACVVLSVSACAGNVKPYDSHEYNDHDREHGEWVRLGRATASYSPDHDRIRIESRNDDFRKLKFRVSNASLNVSRIVVNYENGESESLDVRENISKGGETRAIDLRGGRRSIRSIDFWYDTAGRHHGKAEVTAYGKR